LPGHRPARMGGDPRGSDAILRRTLSARPAEPRAEARSPSGGAAWAVATVLCARRTLLRLEPSRAGRIRAAGRCVCEVCGGLAIRDWRSAKPDQQSVFKKPGRSAEGLSIG